MSTPPIVQSCDEKPNVGQCELHGGTISYPDSLGIVSVKLTFFRGEGHWVPALIRLAV